MSTDTERNATIALAACRPWLLLILFVATWGCSQTVPFRVVHPAAMDLRGYGKTLTVGAVTPNGYEAGAALVESLLRDRIANSLDPAIRLLAEGAPVRITGSLQRYDYLESVRRREHQCPETRTWRDEQGTARTETVPVHCEDVRRTGEAHVTLELSVIREADQRVLFSKVFEESGDAWTEITNSRTRHSWPNPIDAGALLARQAATIVESFCKVIVPWEETVQEKYESCSGDTRCDSAKALIRSGDLRSAELVLTAAGSDNPSARAAALYDRALVRTYSGKYALAREDLRQALMLDPGHAGEWASLSGRIDNLERRAGAKERP